MTVTPPTATNDDWQLVREFAETRSNDAFSAIVRRYIDIVYATALRRVHGDRHLAEDVTQATFIILARRASAFDSHTHLAGWLHRAACYAAANAIKMETRRKHYERQAVAEARVDSRAAGAQLASSELSGVLDDAISRLSEVDRSAVILRFWQDKSLEETGGALGVSAEAAKKRVHRAIEKLRAILARKGMTTLSAASLTTALSGTIIEPAPAALSEQVVTCASGAATEIPSLIAKGAINMMFWTKLKVVATAAIGALLLVGIGTAALVTARDHSGEPAPKPGFVFEAVVERIVNDDGIGKDECIDFDTGKLHSHPGPFKDRAEGREWFRSTGADAHGETEEGSTGLFAMEMAVIPIENDRWNETDATDLYDLIQDAQGQVPQMSGDGDLPLTYLFRTREGGMGVCQLVEVKRDAQQHGWIKVRYKLIKSN